MQNPTLAGNSDSTSGQGFFIFRDAMQELTKNYYKWFCANDYTHIIPDKPGCYAIYTFDYYGDRVLRLVYIGTAQNLRVRLNKHEIIKTLRSLTSDFIILKCKVIEDNKARLETEQKLISRLKPKANIAGIYNDQKR